MRKKWWMWIVLGIIIAVVVSIGIVIAMTKNPKEQKENGNFKIVTSFYPVYIMTINITQGAQNIEVMNLTQNNVGCLHDYTLAASDMRKVENADVFIQNGFGLENFANKIISTYPNLKIVDSSTNVMGRVEGKEGTNPHIWTSVSSCLQRSFPARDWLSGSRGLARSFPAPGPCLVVRHRGLEPRTR